MSLDPTGLVVAVAAAAVAAAAATKSPSQSFASDCQSGEVSIVNTNKQTTQTHKHSFSYRKLNFENGSNGLSFLPWPKPHPVLSNYNKSFRAKYTDFSGYKSTFHNLTR